MIRAVYRVPDGRRLAAFVLPPITIAPGGEAFAYGSTEGQVYLKAIEDIEDRPVTGDGSYADMPFFSPDGQSLGYHDGTSNQLKSVDLAAGGPSRVLADLGGRLPGGARWEPDGTVLYALPDGIWRVSENGGEPERLIAIAAGELAYGPQRLPGGEWILFTQASSEAGQSWDEADIVVAEVATGTRRVVRSGGRDARYLPTGHLVYVRGDVLYAVPFDLNRLSASGTPVAVLDGVRSYDASLGAAAFYAVSDEGTLVYQPGRAAGQSAVAWTGLDGRQEALDLPAGSYSHPRLSPDGRWLAFARQDSGGTDVWVYAVAGGTAMRRLTEGGNNRYPIWSRDGSHVVFRSDRDGDRGIFWQRADGTAPAERLTTAEEETEQIPESWSRTEDRLAFSVKTGSVFELWMWTLADRAAQRFGSAQSLGLFNARFSPDGRWVAYTQRDPVVAMWVASMGAPETRYQVGQDSDVAHHPLWSPDGHRLFYFAGLSPMAVDVTTQSSDLAGAPGGVGPQHGVEDREQLPHARDERDLLRFAGRHQAPIEGANDRVVVRGDERAHVERRTHRGPPPPDDPFAAERPTVAGQRRDAHEGGDAFAIQLAELRELPQERAAHDGADARHRAQEVVLRAPDGAPLDRVVEVLIDRVELAFEPADVVADAPPDGAHRVLEPIALGAQHAHQLPAPPEQGIERGRDRIGQRPWGRADAFRKQREDVGVDAVRLRELAGGPGEVSDLPGVDHHDRQLGRRDGGDSRPFVAPGGLKDDEGGRQVPEPHPEAREATRIVGHAPPGVPGTHSHDQLGLRDVNANHGSGLRHEYTSSGADGPATSAQPCGCGLESTGNCSGSDHGTGNAQATVRSA